MICTITCTRRGFFEFILSMYHQLSSIPPLYARYAIILLTSHVSLLLTTMASFHFALILIFVIVLVLLIVIAPVATIITIIILLILLIVVVLVVLVFLFFLPLLLLLRLVVAEFIPLSTFPLNLLSLPSSCLISVSLPLPATRTCVRLHPSACGYLQIILTRLRFLSLPCASLTSPSCKKRGCGRFGTYSNTARESS